MTNKIDPTLLTYYIIGCMTNGTYTESELTVHRVQEGIATPVDNIIVSHDSLFTEKSNLLRKEIQANNGYVNKLTGANALCIADSLNDDVMKGILSLAEKNEIPHKEIAALGMHGATFAHRPPSSIRETDANKEPYTVQLLSPFLFAQYNLDSAYKNIKPVICYDFRSSYIKQGKEGAPLLPGLAKNLLQDNQMFFGSLVNGYYATNKFGMDTGPFGYILDQVNALLKDVPDSEKNPEIGRISSGLLSIMFNKVASKSGDNFFNQAAPKSADSAEHYNTDFLSELGYAPSTFLRTAEYFCAYTSFHALSHIPADHKMPDDFILIDSGWKNDRILSDFKDLCNNNSDGKPVLPIHKALFQDICSRIGKNPKITTKDGITADIFATMAKCRLENRPFIIYPELGENQIVSGLIHCPTPLENNIAQQILNQTHSPQEIKKILTHKVPSIFSSASAGWSKENKKV